MQYNATDTVPVVGNIDPLVGIAGNIVTISGSGFGESAGAVHFGTNSAKVVSWSDSLIQIEIPAISPDYYDVINNKFRNI